MQETAVALTAGARTQFHALRLQHSMNSTEAGTERLRDGLDSEPIFVELHRVSSLRLRQGLTPHLHTTFTE